MGESKDWGTGLALKSGLLGKMSRLEVHHIFPKAQLYKREFGKAQVNALANFCFLTKDTNLNISDRLPQEYFPKIEEAYPGALESQWIPMDSELWKVENYLDFLEVRKQLLAAELNRRMSDLLHGNDRWLDGPSVIIGSSHPSTSGISSEEEEQQLEEANGWIEEQGLPRGVLSYDFADTETGDHKAVFDLAWPNGIQTDLSQPVAILLNETTKTISIASQANYRCFTSLEDFRRYVAIDILAEALEV